MFIALIIFHVLVCLALILVVLLQSSKGEGLAGSAFGGGGGGGVGGAVFGGRGAGTFLSKATTILAVLFMINCAALAFMSASRTGGNADFTPDESVVTREAQAERERAMQQQQQQQQQGDTAGIPLEFSPPADQGGDNQQEPAPTETDGN